MNIKKAYVEIFKLLEANKNKKVSTVLPELIALMTSKTSSTKEGKTFHKDEEGNVIAIYCYYHKKWELVSEVSYGAKKGTASGYNTMCKEGVSAWTKQQRISKQAKEQLLDNLGNGEITVEEIGFEQQQIEEARKSVVIRTDSHGFDALEDALI